MSDATAPTETEPSLSAEACGRLMTYATFASLSVALVLIASKFGAWLATDSLSLLSTLIDSFLDAGASLINLLAVRRALQPADRYHRFGHGKAEPLAGLAQAAFIFGSAAFLLFEAGEWLFRPRDIENTDIGYAVMVFAILLTLVLVLFQKYVVRRTGSVAIRADSLHYQTDIMINGSVILCLFLNANLGWRYADPLFATGIAAYILWGAWRIGHGAFHLILDRELPDKDRRRIKEIVLANPGVRGLHDMRTRSSGQSVFIQLHLEMDGHLTLFEAHEIAEDVMLAVERAFPGAEVLVHEDPEGVAERRTIFK